MYKPVKKTVKHIALNRIILYKNRNFFIIHHLYYGFIRNIYANIVGGDMMAVLNLYKNGQLVLIKEGRVQDKKCIFENIIYDKDNNILIREDDNIKYELNFESESATIILKEQDYVLNLNLKVLDKDLNNSYHKINYNIESEDVISNSLEIYF